MLLARFLMFLFLSVASAQTPGLDARWRNVGALDPGKKIRVFLTSGDRFRGTVEDFTPQRFTLRADSKSITIERPSVQRITRKSRWRGALYGFIAGAAGGAIFGATSMPYIVDIGNPSAGTRAKWGLGGALYIGGIGAGIGALIGANPAIYRAP